MPLCICSKDHVAEDALVVNHRPTCPRRTNPRVVPIKAGNTNSLYASIATMILFIPSANLTYHHAHHDLRTASIEGNASKEPKIGKWNALQRLGLGGKRAARDI